MKRRKTHQGRGAFSAEGDFQPTLSLNTPCRKTFGFQTPMINLGEKIVGKIWYPGGGLLVVIEEIPMGLPLRDTMTWKLETTAQVYFYSRISPS